MAFATDALFYATKNLLSLVNTERSKHRHIKMQRQGALSDSVVFWYPLLYECPRESTVCVDGVREIGNTG